MINNRYYTYIDVSNGSFYIDVAEPDEHGKPKGCGHTVRWATYDDVQWFSAMGGHVPLGAKVRNGISDEGVRT